MALRILDGNQTATTLSSVVTGGEHIVAHSVVSLGPTAISNIASAVSGIPISGTVTVGNSVTIGSLPVFSDQVGDGINASNINNAFAIVGDSNPPERAVQVAVGGNFDAVSTANPFPISGTVTVGNVAGFNIPTHDFKSFAYTSGNLTQIAYKTGGASGTTVGILTLAYDGNGNLTSMTKS